MSGGIVVVGGGPAGLEAVRAYREFGGEEKVTMISSDLYPPYNRPPLTKEFLRLEKERDELPLEKPGWYRDNEVEIRLKTSVVGLDLASRTLKLSDGETVGYGRCVLATGSRDVLPPIPGADGKGVHTVRDLADSERLSERAREVLDAGGGKFVVIGSGFIGCEAAASLSMLGLEVVMLTMEDAPQAMRLGPEVAEEVSGWLFDLGVEVHTGVEVEEILRPDYGGGFEVVAKGRLDGEPGTVCDGVVVGAGAKPNVEFADKAGLEVDGGIVCDASMRTSDPNVFACGDVALAHNKAAGRRIRVEHWGDALGQGRVCGATLAGRPDAWGSVPGFWSTIGDLTIKYHAWGDGWDTARMVRAPEGGDGFTVWYGSEGRCVGVLTHGRDDDYKRGEKLVRDGAELPV